MLSFRRTNLVVRLNNSGKYCDRSTYRRCRFWQKKKNHLFGKSSFWSWLAFKRAKLWHLGHRKPARIHWKPVTPKMSHCLVPILVQRHNWAIYLRQWARRGHYSQWRSFSGHVERIFVHKIGRGGYWQYLVSTGPHYITLSLSYTRCFVSCLWKISLSTAELMSFGHLELQFDTVGLLFVGCRQR